MIMSKQALQVTVRDQKLEMRWSLLLHCGIHLVVASKKNVSDCQLLKILQEEGGGGGARESIHYGR
jgi:hypothetical protein